MAKQALGRGLGALIPHQPAGAGTASHPRSFEGALEIPIEQIIPNKDQPRKRFEETELEGLADSIRAVGIIEPLVLRKKGQKYEIITGERRWRAAQLANLKAVPAIVKNVADNHVLEIALIENIQRQDLNAIEEAAAYKELLENLNLTQDELSKRVGKSRVAIANSIRLLSLPESVQAYVVEGQLTAGHARAVLMAKSKAQMENLARKAISAGMSVRALETLAGMVTQKDAPADKGGKRKDAGIRDLESRLEEVLGTRVSIRHGKKGGKIEIVYFDLDDLERIMESMTP